MIRALHAEWTKLRTLPSTGWLLLLAVAATVGLSWAITGSLNLNDCRSPCLEDTVKFSLSGVRAGQLAVAILGVLAVTAEYGTRTIQPTLTATPRRSVVLVAKLVVVAALALVAGAVAVAGSFAVAAMVLPGNGFTAANGYAALSLADPLTLRAGAGTTLYFGLVALLGAGIGFVIRDTAGSLTAVLALLFATTVIGVFVTSPVWSHRLHKYSPMEAGLAIQATRDFATTTYIGPWSGVGLLCAYAAAAAVTGLALLRWRDA